VYHEFDERIDPATLWRFLNPLPADAAYDVLPDEGQAFAAALSALLHGLHTRHSTACSSEEWREATAAVEEIGRTLGLVPSPSNPLPPSPPILDDALKAVLGVGKRYDWPETVRKVQGVWRKACPDEPLPSGWGERSIRKRATTLALCKSRSDKTR
jgi:hypothetical protein